MVHVRGAIDKRRIPEGRPRKSWQVTEMWEVHREIARRIVLGQKNVVVAEALNCTQEMVSMVRNSPVIKDQINLMSGAADADCVDLAKRILDIAPQALEVLEDILKDKHNQASLALRAKVAESILDRAGHSKIQKVQSISTHLTADQLNNIKIRALEKAQSAGMPVNITPQRCDV